MPDIPPGTLIVFGTVHDPEGLWEALRHLTTLPQTPWAGITPGQPYTLTIQDTELDCAYLYYALTTHGGGALWYWSLDDTLAPGVDLLWPAQRTDIRVMHGTTHPLVDAAHTTPLILGSAHATLAAYHPIIATLPSTPWTPIAQDLIPNLIPGTTHSLGDFLAMVPGADLSLLFAATCWLSTSPSAILDAHIGYLDATNTPVFLSPDAQTRIMDGEAVETAHGTKTTQNVTFYYVVRKKDTG